MNKFRSSAPHRAEPRTSASKAIAIALTSAACVAVLHAVIYERDPPSSPAPEQSREPQHGAVKVNPKDGLPYVWVPAGSFRMGCSPGDGGCAGYDENPARQVTITKGFWLGKTPVTQTAYERVTGQKPSQFEGANLPVETVEWDEADAYCRAIGGRLPTEAEWEYAARAGTTAERYGKIDEVAWYGANSDKKTHEVGQKKPNAFGLYDMLGNVWQWTADWYGVYLPTDVIDPQGPASGKHRSLRGGPFDGDDRDVRVSMRAVLGGPEHSDETVGFRCVAESPTPARLAPPPPPPPSALGPVHEETNPRDGQTYVQISAGGFQMGCSPGDRLCDDDEKPAHRVSITQSFWLGQTPVTQAAFARVTGQNPSMFPGPDLPVETVSWNEAAAYCRAIGGRLPTESEWEFAARAGTTAERYGNLDEIAWYRDNSDGMTHEVRQKQPNAAGLYDMLGNVSQWTADWYGDNYAAAAVSDPPGPATGSDRTMRGGAWWLYGHAVRASSRSRAGPDYRSGNIGFRCVGP